MAYEYDELNTGSSREENWHRRRAQQQAYRRKILTFAAVLAVSLLVLCVSILRSCQAQDPGLSTQPGTTIAPTVPTVPTTTVPVATEPTSPQTVITLVAGGDINVTDKMVASGEANGQYDYTKNFMDIAPIFAGADAAIVNFEGNLVGSPYGTASSSAPQALMQALWRAGVDFVQTGNSCSVNNGITGLQKTINGIRQVGMMPLGTFASQEEYQKQQGFTICNIGGIRVAFVVFTKGLNGLRLPSGNEHCVNLLYSDYASAYQEIDTEAIQTLLQNVQAQQPDVTIALLHWGSEYNSIIGTRQGKIAQLMLEGGVDAIIGTHSHYVQELVYDQENGTVIAYSLGDLYGDAEKAGTNYSILLELEITRDNLTGQTKITGCEYIPVYTLTPEKDGEEMRVVRLLDAISQYENNHIGCVSETAYENMKAALAKIKAKTGMGE